MDSQEPLLSMEVLPSKPTHSISLEPAALVPGYDQEIHIKIEAGSDFVTSGTLILSGTDGISLIPNNKYLCNWFASNIVTLGHDA